jgi:hypothetical protein
MRFENAKFDWWLWAENAEEALKDVGGTLMVKQACDLLCMPYDELKARLDERSILFYEVPEMYGEGEILIPAFQFQGTFHIPGFHEVWDILIDGCDTPRVCQFFTHETLVENGRSIRDVLCANPTDDELMAIKQKAEAFAEAFMRQAFEEEES